MSAIEIKSQNSTDTCDILSFLTENEERVKAFKFGCCDYINKPFSLDEILIKIEKQLNLKAAREEIMQMSAEFKQEAKECQIQLELVNAKLKMALRDRLTNLPNRASFIESLGNLPKSCQNRFKLSVFCAISRLRSL